MKRKNIKQMIENDQLALGIIMDMPAPEIAEMAGLVGCDFVRVDMEHENVNLETVCNIVRAADTVGISTFVRVPEYGYITSLLDYGVTGIMVPHIKSARQVKELVELVKYYPIGYRGMVGFGRAQYFGAKKMADYIQEANNETLLIIMIEDKEGIENMEEILAVEGVDLIGIGRADISQALGVPGKTSNPKVVEVENRIIEIAQKNNVGLQLTPRSIEETQTYIERGLRCITFDNDIRILYKGAKELADKMRGLAK